MSAQERPAAAEPGVKLDDAAAHRLTVLSLRNAVARAVREGRKVVHEMAEQTLDRYEAEAKLHRAALERDVLATQRDHADAVSAAGPHERALQIGVMQALGSLGVKPEDMGYYLLHYGVDGVVVGFTDRRAIPQPPAQPAAPPQ